MRKECCLAAKDGYECKCSLYDFVVKDWDSTLVLCNSMSDTLQELRDIHKPAVLQNGEGIVMVCMECEQVYPCKTIKVIKVHVNKYTNQIEVA